MPFGLAGLLRALDAALVLGGAASRVRRDWKSRQPSGAGDAMTASADQSAADEEGVSGLTGRIETRLTGLLTAALKQAFVQDRERLELEREQRDAERRRAEEALRLELRRQVIDREVAGLRWLSAMALLGWFVTMIVLGLQITGASVEARASLGIGCLSLLASLGAAVSGQRHLSRADPLTHDGPVDGGLAGRSALWLLLGGLAALVLSLWL